MGFVRARVWRGQGSPLSELEVEEELSAMAAVFFLCGRRVDEQMEKGATESVEEADFFEVQRW